ncbi:MAG: hypothetical protein ACK2T2_13300 [Anaerolineales bacterium]
MEFVELMGRHITAAITGSGMLALNKGKPIDPESVRRYLDKKFGDELEPVTRAMQTLAGSFSEDELKHVAYSLYEKFRPEIPSGRKGWGAKGELSTERIHALAKRK